MSLVHGDDALPLPFSAGHIHAEFILRPVATSCRVLPGEVRRDPRIRGIQATGSVRTMGIVLRIKLIRRYIYHALTLAGKHGLYWMNIFLVVVVTKDTWVGTMATVHVTLFVVVAAAEILEVQTRRFTNRVHFVIVIVVVVAAVVVVVVTAVAVVGGEVLF